MAIDFEELADGKVLSVRASGKLTKEDYEHFVPATEARIKEGKLRILFEMHDFHGWEMSALWEDIKFDIKHFNDIERLAMIGNSKWEKGMAVFCKPFTTAKVQYFDEDQRDEALAWVQAD